MRLAHLFERGLPAKPGVVLVLLPTEGLPDTVVGRPGVSCQFKTIFLPGILYAYVLRFGPCASRGSILRLARTPILRSNRILGEGLDSFGMGDEWALATSGVEQGSGHPACCTAND